MVPYFDDELDRQRDVLLGHGVPGLAGLEVESFRETVARLRPSLAAALPVAGAEKQKNGRGTASAGVSAAPFVIVVETGDVATSGAFVSATVPLLRLAGRDVPGVLDRNHGPEGLDGYRPIAEVGAPPDRVYALVGVERGEEFRNVPPQEALPVILGRGRTPLTLAEGVALALLHPDVLVKNHCFMLSGSRRGDRRVPALWISGRAAKVGWCWDGNPHSWLGVASTATRVAPTPIPG